MEIFKDATRKAGLALGILLGPDAVLAQHAVDVQRLASKGQYYEAFLEYQKIPKRRLTYDASLAAAKSAWALGLPQTAAEEFERAIETDELEAMQEAQATLSRGIIEFQEGRYQVANVYAEKTIGLLELPSPLRAKAWFLWGESLVQLGASGAAEEKFTRALAETPQDEADEAHFAIGRCRMLLGKFADAETSFDAVSPGSPRFAEALRHRAGVALETRNFAKAASLLERGQREFSDFFLDSWVDYALVQAAIHEKNGKKIDEIEQRANEKFPPSDSWLTLLNASVEGYRWGLRGENGKRRGAEAPKAAMKRQAG